jgi:hypothetical protein
VHCIVRFVGGIPPAVLSHCHGRGPRGMRVRPLGFSLDVDSALCDSKSEGVKNRFEWLSADSEGILISLIQKKRKNNPPLWATLAKSVRPPQTPDHWQKCETPDNACNAC